MGMTTALEHMREFAQESAEDVRKWEQDQASILREDWSSVYPPGSPGGGLYVEKTACRRLPPNTVLLLWRWLDSTDAQDQRWFQTAAPLPERFDCLVVYLDRAAEELRFEPYALSLLNRWTPAPTINANDSEN